MGDRVSAGVVYQQIYQTLCAYNLVFEGESKAPIIRSFSSSWCEQVSREQIVYLQSRSPSEEKLRTVFDINLNPNLEKGQFTPAIDEMAADACTLLMAGADTTGNTLVFITWALLNNSQMMHRLKAELRELMPGREDAVDWVGLEKLPYLVSKESRA